MTGRRPLFRLALALAAGVAAAILSAVAIAIVDLYLVGHGHKGLLKDAVSWPDAGMHLSIGDLLLLALSFGGAAVAWTIAGRREGK